MIRRVTRDCDVRVHHRPHVAAGAHHCQLYESARDRFVDDAIHAINCTDAGTIVVLTL